MRALAAGCTCTCRSPSPSGSTTPGTWPSPWPGAPRRMDPTPNQNLTDGLIRPPGSIHPSGGHQILHGTLTDAHRLAATGNPPAVLTALREPAGRGTGRRHHRPPRPNSTRRPRGGGGAAAPVRGPGAGRGLPADRHHRRLRHHQVPVPVRGQAGRAGRRRLGRPHPARRPRPDQQRHLARAGRLLHPVPAPRHPPQGAARRLGQGRRLRHRPTRQEPHGEPCP